MAARRRRWLIALILLALALAVSLGLRLVLQPQRLSDFLLRQAEQATGLILQLDAPADIGLWPDLHIALNGLSARVPGADTPLLRATRVEAALPWSSLRGDTVLRGVRLIEPQLDLPALLAFLDQGDDIGPPSPWRLPTLDAPLQLRDGRVLGDGWHVEQLQLDLPALHDGQATRLDLRGQWQGPGSENALLPQSTSPSTETTIGVSLQLTATPHSDGHALLLDPLALDLALDTLPDWQPHLQGRLSWAPTRVAVTLDGQIAPWPPAWPALPWPPSDSPVALHLHYEGDTRLTGTLEASVLRDENGARLQLALENLLAWLQTDAGHRPPLPPAEGEILVPRLIQDGLEAQGVRLRLSPSPARTDDERNDAKATR